jgi:hypothetical protein
VKNGDRLVAAIRMTLRAAGMMSENNFRTLDLMFVSLENP